MKRFIFLTLAYTTLLANANANEQEPITSVEGTPVKYTKTYTVDMGGNILEDMTAETELIFTEEGDIYFSNIITDLTMPGMGYVYGHREGNILNMPYPQPVFFDDRVNVMYEFALLEAYSGDSGEILYKKAEDSGVITFSVTDDGATIVLDPLAEGQAIGYWIEGWPMSLGETAMVFTQETTSVNKIETIKQVISEEYYDLSGRKITPTAKGIVIKRISYSDGTILINKITR